MRGEAKEVVLDSDGVLRIGGRICVPKTSDLIILILEEAHCSRYKHDKVIESQILQNPNLSVNGEALV